MAWKSANLGHDLHQRLHVLQDGSLELNDRAEDDNDDDDDGEMTSSTRGLLDYTHQTFDDLKQLLHHHGDALVAQQSAHDLNVRWAQKVPIGGECAAVSQVQGLPTHKHKMAGDD